MAEVLEANNHSNNHSNSNSNKEVNDVVIAPEDMEDLTTMTPIQNKYCFWYHRRGGKTQNATFTGYEDSMKQLASFQTVEHFWRVYNHIIRPSDMKQTTDIHLFKDGIKPTWEDPQNKNGGKWMVRLRKGLASFVWEEIVLSVIGEQFDVGHEICGAVMSVRSSEDIISVWNKTAENVEATNKIREHMRRVMRLPSYVTIEYKKHSDSLADKSSFRNPSLVWKPPVQSTSTGHHNNNERHHNKDGSNNNNNNGENNNNNRGDRQNRYNNNNNSNNNNTRDHYHQQAPREKDGDNNNEDGNKEKAAEVEGGGAPRNNAWKSNNSNWNNKSSNNNANNSTNTNNESNNKDGADSWTTRTNKKRDDGSNPAAASAADWINKRPTGNKLSQDKPKVVPGGNNNNTNTTGNAETENVWSRRATTTTTTVTAPKSGDNN